VDNYVAIPRQTVNRSAVFSNGYQTVPILCYHQFTQDKKGRIRMVVPEHEFKEQMAYLYNNGYTVVPLSDVGLFIRGKKQLPDKSVVITIDDGYKSYMEIALPILEKYNFYSTMFVYPEFVGAGIALKWRDVKKLNEHALVDIQSHSKTHDSLSRKPLGESDEDYQLRLTSEVVEAEQIIAKRTGNVINQFAYPYGNSSPVLIEMLEENEYDLAVTVERGNNPAFSAPFLLNRTMIYGGDSLDSFKRALGTFERVDLR
jgi:peptidoglycan/xylan/chitin deacetylase (PgdA/CDA1 family)